MTINLVSIFFSSFDVCWFFFFAVGVIILFFYLFCFRIVTVAWCCEVSSLSCRWYLCFTMCFFNLLKINSIMISIIFYKRNTYFLFGWVWRNKYVVETLKDDILKVRLINLARSMITSQMFLCMVWDINFSYCIFSCIKFNFFTALIWSFSF